MERRIDDLISRETEPVNGHGNRARSGYCPSPTYMRRFQVNIDRPLERHDETPGKIYSGGFSPVISIGIPHVERQLSERGGPGAD